MPIHSAARTLVCVIVVAAAAFPGAAAAAPTITQVENGAPSVQGVAAGADGTTWYTVADNPGQIVRLAADGAITRYTGGITPGFTDGGKPQDIVEGPGGMWFTASSKNVIGRIAGGTVTEFPGSPSGKPNRITVGPDGNLWYTAEGNKGAIARMTPTGSTIEFTAGLSENGEPKDITTGPDGNLWFTEPTVNRIGRITRDGLISEFATGAAGGIPNEIVTGPDGNLWFTLAGTTPAIVRMTPQGAVTHFTAGLPLGSAPEGITVGGDGNMHFTDTATNTIGTVTPQGVITTTSAGLTPASDLREIVSGADGALWFSEYRGAIGRMTVAPRAGSVALSRLSSDGVTVTAPATPNSQATTAYFEWGTTTAYGQVTPNVPLTASGDDTSVSASLTGLAASTTYHARLVTTNATGTHRGPDRTFTTTVVNAPTATTEPASAVDGDGVTLNATVNPNGNATTYHFEWGPTAAYGSRVPLSDASVGADTVDHVVSQALAGLAPNTTYHYRVVASSAIGVSFGDERTFTTDAVAPQATSAAVSSITASGATLTGSLSPRNSETTYRFEWGRTAAYGNAAPVVDAVVGDDDAVYGVSETLTGLDPNTTYHFRLVATSSAGSAATPDSTFTTAKTTPLVQTAFADEVSSSGATLRGSADPRNAATLAWFEWGTTTGYGQSTPPTALPAADLQAHPVRVPLAGLAPSTAYHFRLVAQSEAGIAYGPDQQLTTTARPADATPATPAPAQGDPSPAVLPGVPGLGDLPPAPRYGRAVGVGVAAGTVRVKTPGSTSFTTLEAGKRLPNGSEVDARAGTVLVVSALDAAGRTQQASFGGARFSIKQKPSAKGMVDIVLREAAVGCRRGRSKSVARAAGRTRPRARRLWARDRGGRYRTHGRNSVATVRGTRWSTTETCAGTRTTVTEGAVAVWDKRKRKRTLVKAGGSYLARSS